jgi:hypothetical protein
MVSQAFNQGIPITKSIDMSYQHLSGIPFGLTNAPASFQHFINDVLLPHLDVFAIAYPDDILIYHDNLNDYRNHVLKVLEALSEAGLHLKPKKFEFHQ